MNKPEIIFYNLDNDRIDRVIRNTSYVNISADVHTWQHSNQLYRFAYFKELNILYLDKNIVYPEFVIKDITTYCITNSKHL